MYTWHMFQTNIKNLASASVVIGKLMKKSAKRTDEEILAAFGQEVNDSDEDETVFSASQGGPDSSKDGSSKTGSLFGSKVNSPRTPGFGKSIFSKLRKQG